MMHEMFAIIFSQRLFYLRNLQDFFPASKTTTYAVPDKLDFVNILPVYRGYRLLQLLNSIYYSTVWHNVHYIHLYGRLLHNGVQKQFLFLSLIPNTL